MGGDYASPPITTTSVGLYHNRNRSYSPHLGRFVQSDPNATGVVTAFHGSRGRSPVVGVDSPELLTLLGDGFSRYESLGSNPAMRVDPAGLSWDPFDAIDEIIFEHQASKVLALAKVNAYFTDKEVLRKIRAYESAGFEWMELIWDRDTAILFSMIGGSFFSTICFEEGTPVVMANGSLRPIESVALGEAVRSARDPHAGESAHASRPMDPDAHDHINPATWRTVELRLEDPRVGTVRVSLLRPVEWVEATGLKEGRMFALHLPEMAIRGLALVAAISPCPAIELPPPGGHVVTATFVTERAEIVRVWLEGKTEPIGATPSHPFYSEDREGWVPAGELRRGESVRTLAGAAKVEWIEPVAEPTAVYNFEVHRSHTYYVCESQVWVHNPCVQPGPSAWNRLARSSANQRGLHAGQLSRNFHRIKTGAGLRPVDKTLVDDVTGDVLDNTQGSETFGQLIGNVFDP